MWWATNPLQFSVFNLVVPKVSKKRIVLELNTKVKVIEASEKDKLSVKEIVINFHVRKSQVCDMLKAGSE
jgi:hypothetical protein